MDERDVRKREREKCRVRASLSIRRALICVTLMLFDGGMLALYEKADVDDNGHFYLFQYAGNLVDGRLNLSTYCATSAQDLAPQGQGGLAVPRFLILSGLATIAKPFQFGMEMPPSHT